MECGFVKITRRSWEFRINGKTCGVAVIDPSIPNNWVIPGGDKLSDQHRMDIIASFVKAWNSMQPVKDWFMW